MRVRVSYGVDVSDRDRLAIARYFSVKGRLATREEVATFFEMKGTNGTFEIDDLLVEIDRETAELVKLLKES